MGQRNIRRMLRKMSGGQPVEVTRYMTTMRGLARMVAIAEEFGYRYTDIRQGAGKANGFAISLVPDPRPQAQERAERNQAKYPDALIRGSLPALPPDILNLYKARISYDLATRHNDKQRAALAYVGLTVTFTIIAVRLGTGLMAPTNAVTVSVAIWAVMTSTVPALASISRRNRARQAAILEEAGFTRSTDPSGRLRYLPSHE